MEYDEREQPVERLPPFPLGNYLTLIVGLLKVGVRVLVVGIAVAGPFNGVGTEFQLLDRAPLAVPRSRPEGCVGAIDFTYGLVAVTPLLGALLASCTLMPWRAASLPVT